MWMSYKLLCLPDELNQPSVLGRREPHVSCVAGISSPSLNPVACSVFPAVELALPAVVEISGSRRRGASLLMSLLT